MSAEKDGKLCEHEEVHRDRSIWVKPSLSERKHSPAERRTYCVKCGKIRYIGSARTKKMGYYVNLLKEIKNRCAVLKKRGSIDAGLTKVQMRMIIKALEEDDFFLDSFCNHRYGQWEQFKRTLRKYSSVPDHVMESVYRDFKG